MAFLAVTTVPNLSSCYLSKTHLSPFRIQFIPVQSRGVAIKRLVVEAKMRKRANSTTESAKIRNRRMRRKYNGTRAKPRLSVFCSEKHLYAMLVDDENKKCLFYGSTLQNSIRNDPNMSTSDAAKVVGEELIKTAIKLKISEISCYDRNGLSRGERMEAFETAISEHGFLPR